MSTTDSNSELYSEIGLPRSITQKYSELFVSNNIHFVWIGSPARKDHFERLNEWKSANPGATVLLWTDQDLESLPNGPWSNVKLHPAQRADLLRIWIVFHFGGWYVDIDCAPGKIPLPFQGHSIFAREDGRRFVNGFFYSEKWNPFLKHWAKELELSLGEARYTSIAEQSGPIALSRAIHTWNLLDSDKQRSVAGNVVRWSDFTHLPNFLFSSKNWKRILGKMALHFGESSWDSVPNSKKRFLLFKQLFYLARHTNLEPFFEFIRLVIIHQLPPKANLPLRIWWRVFLNTDLAYVGRSKYLEYANKFDLSNTDCYGIERDLSIQILIFQPGSATATANLLGWVLKRTINHDYVIRPNILEIIP